MINRRQFLVSMAGAGVGAAAVAAGGSGLATLAWGAPPATAASATNLLLITADDLNCDSVGWMGCKLGSTPHMDEYAKASYCFAHLHSSAPICQPSREALMTGRVPHRSGGLGFNPINADVPTLWESLHAAGYFTAGFHKLSHMAPREKFAWDLVRAEADNDFRDPATYFRCTREAIAAAKSAGKPFFINVNIADPHRPFYDSEQGARKGKTGAAVEAFAPKDVPLPGFLDDIPDVRREVAQYFSSVRRFDLSFEQTLRALNESGQADRTLVVFTSDHGMAFPFAKTTLYRCGTWNPTFMRMPGVTKPALDADHMLSNTDLMPTILELLGVAAPAGMDGRSLVPILNGQRQRERDHVFTHVTSTSAGDVFPSRAVRTRNCAYIFNAWADGKTRFKNESMSGLSFKAMQAAAGHNQKIAQRVKMFLYRTPEEFYDLRSDPWERTNSLKDPDCYLSAVRTWLKPLLLEHMKSTNDPLLRDFQKLT